MKKKNILKILIMFIAVSLCLVLKNNVQAMTVEEAGKYVAEFAINFFDAHNSETKWDPSDERKLAYKGEKSSDGKYHFDCVGWVSFAIHQAIGIGNASWTEFGVPAGNGNTPIIGGGYEAVLGTLGSRKKISLEELKQTLKPGDIVFKTDQHVMLYVGDNTIIHSTGHGPGPEYGGEKEYALVKSTLDHYYNEEGFGIEAVARLSESAAAAINESNCTTIMGQAGSGLTGVWEKASQGNVGTSSSNSSSSNSSLANKLSVTGMNEDLSLGLRYPKDNSNTPLNKFIDFTLPYLQTWMIPLAMNSGIMTKIEDDGSGDYIKNPMFGYLTIKEAMSDVLVERYDITKCTLKTRYKVYDVITYSVSYDEKKKKWVKTETSRTSVDESSKGAMAEDFVSKNFDVETKYYIKKAHMFDVKIDNECTYTKYSDSDVEKRIEDGVGFQGKDKSDGDSFSEGGDPGPSGESKDDYSYTVKEGHYVNVTRIWQDKFEPNDNTQIEPYEVEDVEEYIKNGGAKKQTTASYSQTGDIYNCKGYELTDDEITKLAGLAVGEAGTDEDELATVVSHMANLWEYWNWGKVSKYTSRGSLFNAIYWKHSAGGWYADVSFNSSATDTAIQVVKSVLVEGKRTLPPYADEFDSYSEMIKSKGKIVLLDGKQASNYAEAKAMVEAAVPGVTKVRGAWGR